MGPEQELDLTDKSDVDPSINPTKIVVQEGDDAGRIAAVETSEGTRPNWYSPRNEAVEGLPVIGAYAANEQIDRMDKDNSTNTAELYHSPEEIERETDRKAIWAMAEAVHDRAVNLATKQFPNASPEKIKEFGQKASDKFLAEHRSKSMEKKAQRIAEHDSGVQRLIDGLKSDTPLPPELMPDTSEHKVETPEQESQAA